MNELNLEKIENSMSMKEVSDAMVENFQPIKKIF